MAEKPCPECAEPVERTEVRCRHCGANLETRFRQRGPAPFLKRRVSNFAWLAFLIGVPGTLIAGIIAFDSWGGPSTGQLFMTGLFTLLVLGGVFMLIHDLGQAESEKQGRGHMAVLSGCLAVPAIWAGLWFALFVVALNVGGRRPPGNATAAIGALKTIGTAQSLFREADKEGDGNLDYGSLSELANSGTTGLIDKVLGSGTKNAYLFTCTYSPTTSEFLWFATASPTIPGTTGDRYFCINHEGVTYYTTSQPFVIDPITCEIPDSAQILGSGRSRGEERERERQQRIDEGAPLVHVQLGQVYVFRKSWSGRVETVHHRVVKIKADRVLYQVDKDQDNRTWIKSPHYSDYYAKTQRKSVEIGGRTWTCQIRKEYDGGRVWTAQEQNSKGEWVTTFPGIVKEVDAKGETTLELVEVREPK